MDYLIQVRDLELDYHWGDHHKSIFQAFNCNIPPGAFVSITGANGSGKSSLLKLIMGLIEPNSGAIIVGERQVRFGYVDGVKDGQIAYLAQQMDELFFGETVAQELSYQKEQLTSEDHQLLEQLNMEHLLPRRIDTLSGGEKQGIALVQFLANSAPLLLLDEPSSYLDKQAAQVLRKALVRAHEQGRTIVHATQFKREVAWGSHVLDLDSQQPRVERL